MTKGTVDFFNDQGGYGFIKVDEDEETDLDDDEDVFYHMEDIGGSDLEEETDVEFEIEQSQKGPRASNLTRL
jgi:CspA family cold shock protein